MNRKIAVLLSGTIVMFCLVLAANPAYCQEKEPTKKEKKELKLQAIHQMVESKNYKVIMQQASSSRGRNVNITGSYTIVVTPDRIRIDLPYYGQAHGGVPYGGDGGVTLDSKDFTYESKPAKKGGWDITITPKDDTKDVRIVNLGISSDGYASANITFMNRTPMRYTGVLEVEPPK